MSLITTIADALVAALNGGQFSRAFTARRAYRPLFELADLADLRVTIVPRAVETAPASRTTFEHDVQIDLAVQKRLAAAAGGADELAEIDGLMGLVQELAQFIRARRQFGAAAWVRMENAPIYSPEHLAELRVFTGVLTVTLKVMTG